MIRVSKMSGKLYGFNMRGQTSDDIMEDIKSLVDEGTPVIIVNDLSDLEAFDIDPDDVKMVAG